MQDWSYFDIRTDNNGGAPSISDPRQIRDEMLQLNEIADKLGCYRWDYKEDFADTHGTDTQDHIGPVAQQLLKIPGLAGAVIQAEDGTLAVNTNYAALAALGLVAALARLVLNKGEGINNAGNEELSGAISEPANISAGTEGAVPAGFEEVSETTGEGTDGSVNAEIVQPAVETAEAAGNTADTGTGADATATNAAVTDNVGE